MESVENREVKKQARRSKKVKNLEEEVEFIFSQDESEEDLNDIVDELLPKTPSRRDRAKNPTTPTAAQGALHEILQTPRRSCRKSVRPAQEYDDIVNKSLRSCTRSSKKHLLITEEETTEDIENQETEVMQPKWTPAKVGRVSQRRGRKSRRTDKGKRKENKKETKEQGEDEIKYVKKEEVEEVSVEEVAKGNRIQAELVNITIDHKEQVDEIENMEHVEEKSEPYVFNNEHQEEQIDNKIQDLLEQATKEKINQEEQDKELVEDKIEHNEEIIEVENNMDPIEAKTELDTSENDNEVDYEEALENPEEPIHLLQEESEDCKEFENKSEQENICIVFESNISNHEIKFETEDNTFSLNGQRTKRDKLEGSFGSYLKSKKINISDLGLNLLKDEQEERDVVEVDSQIKPSEEAEEMPSLIVCDEEDDDEEDFNSENKCNVTFETKDIEETMEKDTECCEKTTEEIMETLQMSEDECESPRKRPRIVPGTPVQKQKQNIFGSAIKINPKEFVLRGIRKRSLSVCINGSEQKPQKPLAGPLAKAKQDRMVSFYSPANQQTIIDDLDMMIAKSLKKQKQESKNASSKFVTTRRKRSISFDDSLMSTSQISKLPRPILNHNVASKPQQQTASTSKPLSRTKLPNFAAIHQKQFKKMENLVEHVNRKQERSKNLINSATKLRPVSAQKNISIMKNSNNNIQNEKPRALKKIDLGATAQMNKSLLNSTIATSTAALNRTQDGVTATKVVNLPDPRLAKIIKPLKSRTISHRPVQQQQQQIKSYLKPLQASNIEKSKINTKKAATSKPTFNLSTSLMAKPTTSTSNIAERANTSHMSNEDKMASRLQRHMDLFKGRVPSARAGVASRKNEVLLKGVRSNRRFELQMQHRKNLEQ